MMSSEFQKCLENETAVAGQALRLFQEKALEEITTHSTKGLQNAIPAALESMAAGFVLSRSPIFSKVAGAAFLCQELGLSALATSKALGDGWQANDQKSRQQTANEISESMLKRAGEVAEVVPSFLLGSALGGFTTHKLLKYQVDRANDIGFRLAHQEARGSSYKGTPFEYTGDSVFQNRTIAKLAGIPLAFQKNFELDIAQTVYDKTVWRHKNLEQLPASVKHESGALNMLDICKWLQNKHSVWTGVEQGRNISLTDLRVTHAYQGVPTRTIIPGMMKGQEQIQFHVHPPDKIMSDTSIPSPGDLRACKELSVIQSGQRTTIFQGLGSDDITELLALNKRKDLPVKALVFDPRLKMAMEVDTKYVGPESSLENIMGRPLEYEHVEALLSNWNRKTAWQDIAQLPTAPKTWERFNFCVTGIGVKANDVSRNVLHNEWFSSLDKGNFPPESKIYLNNILLPDN